MEANSVSMESLDHASGGRQWTVSIAVPSSIVDNAQSPELKSYLVGQIARSLVIYNVDEIVVYDEYCIPGFVIQASVQESTNWIRLILVLPKKCCLTKENKPWFKWYES